MLLGHSQALGQINASDVFTRLLYGIIHTGLAPRSFYGSAGPQHYNGVPVDFAAGSIAALSVQRSSDHRIYHVINPHRADGASLDTIVDWVESAGYPIERLWPHAEWFRRFKEALRALPDIENKQRSYSPLPTLQQWEHPAERIPLELDAARFQEALRTSTRWQDVPKLSEPYIHRFLQNMAHLGLIKRPRSA